MIKQRLFLVGCPRSGTTFLQSLLAAHPQITSFPESHLYSYLIPSRPWLVKLGIASRWSKLRFQEFLQEINRQEMEKYLPWYAVTIRQYSNAFIKTLDYLAEEEGNHIWLEKTPDHLSRIEYIQRLVPNYQFIHIIRRGEDVIASLYEVTNQYYESWYGSTIKDSNYVFKSQKCGMNIDQCIEAWTTRIEISKKYFGRKNHIFVSYENLVNNPKYVLDKLCKFIGIEYADEMLEASFNLTDKIILNKEPWKKDDARKSKNIYKKKKIDLLFDVDTKNYILNKISNINLNCLIQE